MKALKIGGEIFKGTIEKILDELYEEIKHGDDEHKKWLKDKIEEYKQNLFKDE